MAVFCGCNLGDAVEKLIKVMELIKLTSILVGSKKGGRCKK
jgi:hypothetical protein